MSSNKKRILIFSLAYEPVVGGAELAVREITSRLPEIDFHLLTLRFKRAHQKRERVGNVEVHRIGLSLELLGPLAYLMKVWFVPLSAYKAYKLSLANSFDAYWCLMTYMLFPVRLLRLFTKDETPYLLTLQDGDPFERVFNRPHILPFRPWLRRGFVYAWRVQAISSYLARWAKMLGFKGEVAVIPNGVDVSKFSNPSKKTFNPQNIILITTSRLVEKNAVGDIIEALKFLPENVSLKIIGSGPLEQELKLQAKSSKLEARVQFLGHIAYEDIPKHLHEADIFVRPSLSEGFGSSFIEAMAAGLPVVATPVGGITDFLVDGETGIFCQVRNPKSVAEAVMRLVEDDQLRTKVAKNARRMVEGRYEWDDVAVAMGKDFFSKI